MVLAFALCSKNVLRETSTLRIDDSDNGEMNDNLVENLAAEVERLLPSISDVSDNHYNHE